MAEFQDDIDTFSEDFRIVLDLVERLPSLLGLRLRAFASLVGTPSTVVDLLDDGPPPQMPRYGRADLVHDGDRFRILALGTRSTESDVFNSKACLALLRHPEVLAALTVDERAAIERTVPETWFPIDEARLLRDQPRTILRPATGARGEETTAGWAVSAEEWQAAVVTARMHGGYVAQRRVSSRSEAVWRMHYGPEIHSLEAALPPTVIAMYAPGSQLPLSVAPACALSGGVDTRI